MSCPIAYELNCQYASILCHKCFAKGGRGDLEYKPINHHLKYESHPAYADSVVYRKRLAKQGKVNRKVGNQVEKRLNKTVGAKHNISSIGFDGILESVNLKIETKCRLSEKASPWPTKEEWEKAKLTGVEILIISKQADDKEARVCMSLDTLKALINAVDKASS